ncbi:subtilisin family serine protease [Pedobacter sp. UYP24]
MNLNIKPIFLATVLVALQLVAFSQDKAKPPQVPNGWHLLDQNKDGFNGISLNKAYSELLSGKTSKTITVAVIDSGVDTLHEDLKSVLWRNVKEIAGNGKDDDKNGYVDDVYGWNFLGGKDGRNVSSDSEESVRLYFKLKSQAVIAPKDTALWTKLQTVMALKAKTSKISLDIPPIDVRGVIVKDNYADFSDKYYGNPDVMADFSFHGTHCSGIIGAKRDNGIGVDGVADNVRIMMVRTVPNGDEHDKDIALAIRYAVDNGAKVISMSFGKGFSPEKKWVDEAVRYAEKKGVLLVHAAGNDHKNIDVEDNFPNQVYLKNSKRAKNMITVGASADPGLGGLTASFSNYGKTNVDVFAPGVKIYSTIPGGNTYGNASGTSMAAPVVAGLAALILEYYPKLKPAQVKDIIVKSCVKPAANVKKPGTKEEVSLSDLCVSGGIVNAYEALKLAATYK